MAKREDFKMSIEQRQRRHFSEGFKKEIVNLQTQVEITALRSVGKLPQDQISL